MTYLTEILQFNKCSKKENSFIASKRSKFSEIHSGSFLETMKEFHFSRISFHSKRNLNEFPKESEKILEKKEQLLLLTEFVQTAALLAQLDQNVFS